MVRCFVFERLARRRPHLWIDCTVSAAAVAVAAAAGDADVERDANTFLLPCVLAAPFLNPHSTPLSRSGSGNFANKDCSLNRNKN